MGDSLSYLILSCYKHIFTPEFDEGFPIRRPKQSDLKTRTRDSKSPRQKKAPDKLCGASKTRFIPLNTSSNVMNLGFAMYCN